MPDTLKEEQAVLRLDNVSKNFGGVVAASDICIQLFRGGIWPDWTKRGRQDHSS